MARCIIGKKKVEKYKKQTGLPVVAACTRGGTNHRIDLYLEDGSLMRWFKNGEIQKDLVVGR